MPLNLYPIGPLQLLVQAPLRALPQGLPLPDRQISSLPAVFGFFFFLVDDVAADASVRTTENLLRIVFRAPLRSFLLAVWCGAALRLSFELFSSCWR